jgi:hypothetical protein
MSDKAQIGAELTLDSSSYLKGLGEAARQATEWAGGLSSLSPGGLLGAIGGVGAFAGAAGAVGLLSVGIGSLVSEIQRLNEQGNQNIHQQERMAERFGISTEAAAALQLQARQMGLSQDEMAAGLSNVTRLLAEAEQGSQRARRAFGHLGLDMAALGGDPTRALNEITIALARLNPQQQQQAIRELARGNQEFGQMLARVGRSGGLEAVMGGAGMPSEFQRGEGVRARGIERQITALNARTEAMRENQQAGPGFTANMDLAAARFQFLRQMGVGGSEMGREWFGLGNTRPVGRALNALSTNDLLQLNPSILAEIRRRQNEVGAGGELPADIMARIRPQIPAASPAEQAQMGARRFLAQLQEDETRLRLGGGGGLAHGLSFGSAAAINQINAARMEAEAHTIGARIARRDQALAERHDQQAEDVAAIRQWLDNHPQGPPVNIN